MNNYKKKQSQSLKNNTHSLISKNLLIFELHEKLN